MLRDDRRTFMTNAVNDVTNGFMGTKITNVGAVTVSTLLTKVTNNPLLWLRYCAESISF
jgi:hypothetical protein